MRGNGRVYRPTWTVDGVTHTAKVWWIDYQVRGQRYRESSKSTVQKKALDLLHARVGDRREGRLVGNPDDVTVHDLRELVERQYDLDGRRSKRRIKQCWAHLEEFLSAETHVPAVTTVRVDEYRAARLAAGAAPQTLNNELSALRRGFRLATKKGLLGSMPVIELPRVENARAGFFEDGDLGAVLVELPDYLRPLIRFLRLTGWRRSEGANLTWAAIDWDDQAPDGTPGPVPGAHASLRLHAMETKGKAPRVFPFGAAPELSELLVAQWAARRGPLVFQRDGQPLGDFRHAWDGACKRAGVARRLVHDLRRTAARDYRRAGLAESDIMELCGWETREMFKRYAIKDEGALSAAVAKRFANGKVAAKSGAAADPA